MLQKGCLLGTVKIVRKVLDTWVVSKAWLLYNLPGQLHVNRIETIRNDCNDWDDENDLGNENDWKDPSKVLRAGLRFLILSDEFI